MIYFDNSATLGYVPFCVKRAICKELKNPANAGRSGHKQAISKLNMINSCRNKLSKMFGVEFEKVIFCKSCTEALNLAIFGLTKPNSHIITTELEHNSVLRPLYSMPNIKISVAKTEYGKITLQAIKNKVTAETDVVAINLVSNVTGATCEIEKIADFCRKKKIKLICDGAQAVSHMDLNVDKLGIDALAIAPHKSFYAPSGLGVLLLGKEVKTLQPRVFGGNGLNSISVLQSNEFPDGLESGTANTLAIAGLSKGLDYYCRNKQGIWQQTKILSQYLFDSLRTCKKVKIYSQKNNFGIVSFLVEGFDSGEVADFLDGEYGIATRSGLTCAPLVHKSLGTQNSGLVRVSVAHFNRIGQINKLIFALKKFVEIKQ